MLLKYTSRMASCLFLVLLKIILSTAGGLPNHDIILGGIFSEHFPRMLESDDSENTDDNNACGKPNFRATADRLAMEFAVFEINEDESILPDIRLGTNMKDTCSDLDHAVNKTLDYQFIKSRFVNTSQQCEPRATEAKCCLDHTENNATLVAIVAGAYSHIVKAIVNLVGLFKVPVIGYSSTSPSLNKMDYFLRTVAPDTVVAKVMVDLILKLRWNMVLVLYVDNEFGNYAADCFRTAIRRTKPKICIAYDEKFSEGAGSEEIQKIVKGIKDVKSLSRVIAFFGTIEDFIHLQNSSADWDVNEYIWISSGLWLRSDLIDISRSVKHILAIIPKQVYPCDFHDYLRHGADVNKICPDMEHNEITCNRSEGENCSVERSKYTPHVLDAVYAVAMGIHNMLGCRPGKSCRDKLEILQQGSLLHFLKNLSYFNHLTNQTISFDINGNPRTAQYTVVKLSIGAKTYNNTTIGHWKCGKKCMGPSFDLTTTVNASAFGSNCGSTCKQGWYKSVKDDYPDCCWTCERCTGNKYTNTSSQYSCFQCSDDQWPNSNHTKCTDIRSEYLGFKQAPGILILAWNCFGVAIILFVVRVFVKYSESHIVKASSRHLSLLLLLGILMDFVLITSLLWEPNVIQCAAVFVLTHVSNCLVTATLFMKTNRIHRIFRKSAMTERPRCLGNACQLSIIMTLVIIEVVLAVTVLVIRPENADVKVTYDTQGDSKKAFLLCNYFGKTFQNDIFHVLVWSYDCGMIFVCTYQAYLVRKVPENYNEARYITFTMVTVSMNIIVFVIMTSGMDGKNLVLVYCIFQSLKASVALSCMFLPKVYVILFQPEKNVPHNPVQSKLGTFVEENSTVKVKANESISSSSHTSESSEPSTGGTGTAYSSTLGRPYRKVGAKTKKRPEAKFESTEDFDNLRARVPNASTRTAQELKGSADVVFVNGLVTSQSVV